MTEQKWQSIRRRIEQQWPDSPAQAESIAVLAAVSGGFEYSDYDTALLRVAEVGGDWKRFPAPAKFLAFARDAKQTREVREPGHKEPRPEPPSKSSLAARGRYLAIVFETHHRLWKAGELTPGSAAAKVLLDYIERRKSAALGGGGDALNLKEELEMLEAAKAKLTVDEIPKTTKATGAEVRKEMEAAVPFSPPSEADTAIPF